MPRPPQQQHKIYELTLQLLQLWGVKQQQTQQQQQQQRPRRRQLSRSKTSKLSALQLRSLSPDLKAEQQQQQQQTQQQPQQQQQQQQQRVPEILRFVVYIPAVNRKWSFANHAHFLAFCTRSWMLPAAAPLLRAVAAAAAGTQDDLQQLTVMNTDSNWWSK